MIPELGGARRQLRDDFGSTTRRLFSGLPGFREGKDDFADARCPFHKDDRPSLRINLRTGWANCRAGCGEFPFADFAERMGWPVEQAQRSREPLLPTYVYTDGAGTPVFGILRLVKPDGKKDFRTLHPNGCGWKNGLGGARRVPYHLSILMQADPADPVFWVEGEKDADNGASAGLLTTTSPNGVNSFRKLDHASLKVFAGRRVHVIPDNDEPGRKYAAEVVDALTKAGASASILELPGLPPKGDLSDWLASGGARAQLLELAGEAATERTKRKIPALFHRMSTVTPQRVEWLVQHRIALGKLAVIGGPPGLGKSMATIALAAAVTRGTSFLPDTPPCPLGSVLLLSAEDDPADTLRPRLDAAGADVDRVVALTMVREPGPEGTLRTPSLKDDLAIIEQILRDELPDCRLIVIDPITAYLGIGAVDSYKDSDVRSILHPLADLAGRLNVAVLVVMHHRKAAGGSADYRIGGSLGFVAAARTVLHVAPDPEDSTKRLLVPGKSNLGPPACGWSYCIEEVDGAPRIKWLEPVEMTADDALAEDAAGSSAVAEAEEWLKFRLADYPTLATKIVAEARKQNISERTLQRAKRNLGVTASKKGFGGAWAWSLPKAANPSVSDVGDLGGLRDEDDEKTPQNGASSKGRQTEGMEGCHYPAEGRQDAKGRQADSGVGDLWTESDKIGVSSSSSPPGSTKGRQPFTTPRARAGEDEFLMEVPLL